MILPIPSSLPPLKSQKDGFTLVEILVVMGLTALLCVLMFAVGSRAAESANSAKCVQNMRQLGQGNSLYMQDHNNRITPALDPNGFPPTMYPDKPWYLSLQPYLPPQPDPSAIRSDTQGKPCNENGMRATLFCPTIPKRASEGKYTGYGWNANFGSPYFIKGSQLDTPARTVLAWDDTQKNLSNGEADNPNGGWPSASRAQPWWYEFSYCHQQQCHLLMMDGHVESVKKQLFGDARDYPNFIWERPNT